MLVIVLRRGHELLGPSAHGATYAVLLQELVDVTGLSWDAMMGRVGQLATRELVKVEAEDWAFDEFSGPYAATRPSPDLQWDDLISYCQVHTVPLTEVLVNLRFDLLDEPTMIDTDRLKSG